MKKTLIAGIVGAMLMWAGPASAGCGESGNCGSQTNMFKNGGPKKAAGQRHKVASHVRKAASHMRSSRVRLSQRKRLSPVVSQGGGRVVAMIKAMAPGQGVPAWFALRIAKVESNYNSHLRGRAGEYGVFQLKCATAKGIGFSGNCSALLDARTNIRYGLRHLALAMKSSRGNLRLAASKHNGGLGRKTIVYGYVAKVF